MVVDLHVIGDQILAVLDRDARVFLVLLELGQFRLRCHPDHAAIATLVQALGPQHDVQRLVPRHVDQAQGYVALHAVGGDHVEVGFLRDQLQHGTYRHVLEVEGDRLAAVAALAQGRRGLADRGGGDRARRRGGLARADLDHVFVAALVGQRLEGGVGVEHQLRAAAIRLGIDALHGRGEVGHVDRLLQVFRQACVADVDDDAVALAAQIRARALTIELQDQPAGAIVAALEVDLGHRQRGRRGRRRGGGRRFGHCAAGRGRHQRAVGHHERDSQRAQVEQLLAPDGTQPHGVGKGHRAIPIIIH
ncbi:hypothetical protein D3C71_1397010 [compost metagenome]